MLMSRRHESGPPKNERDGDEIELNFDKLFAMARRQFWVVVSLATIGLLIGLVYVLTAVPLYTARTHVMIDNRSMRALEDMSAMTAIGGDQTAIDSEVEVIRSEQIGMRVIERLELIDNPGFMNPPSGNLFSVAFGAVRSVVDPRNWFSSDDDAFQGDLAEAEQYIQRQALRRLQGNLEVRRVGRTFVLEIAYTSHNRRDAARIANGIANAYLTDQLDSRYEATQRAGVWMQERISELEQQARESDLAVQRFRSENDLVAAGGQLISEQQLSEVASQLTVARADTARARARYDRIRSIIDAGESDAIVGDALSQSVFNELRSRYLDANKRMSDLSERLGPDHVQVVNLRNEMRQFERLIFEELRRIAESYFSDYEVARSRERSLEESLEAATGTTALAQETLVQLRGLESRASTYRTLLDNFQQRFEESAQQQSFPITDARIISPASNPENPSHPRTTLSLALSLVLGGMIGVGVGLFREFSDRVFRTGAQVREELDTEFLGMLPRLDNLPDKRTSQSGASLLAEGHFAAPPIMRHTVDAPLSGYAESLRGAKVAADIALSDQNHKVIGVVSSLPGEGKSTTAANFANLLAKQGKRTLLIDADMRNPGLTRETASRVDKGLIEHLLNETPVEELILEEVDSGLHFLPCILRTRISHTSDLLASPTMRALLDRAGKIYDYVIVDLPPLNPVIDVRAAAASFDGFLFVIEWGKTARAVARTTLLTEQLVHNRCLGVVFNKVDKDKLMAYEDYGSKDYYYGRYTNYYQHG